MTIPLVGTPFFDDYEEAGAWLSDGFGEFDEDDIDVEQPMNGCCPECRLNIEDVLFDNAYFKAEGGEPANSIGGVLTEAIVWGEQTCPHCGYKFYLEG